MSCNHFYLLKLQGGSSYCPTILPKNISDFSLRKSEIIVGTGLLTLGKIYEYNSAKFWVFFPIFEYNVKLNSN
jgi:hypothetical protein